MSRTLWELLLLHPCGFRGVYDAFADSIVHAYEPARRVLSSYAGPLVRLRRATDNAEANFGYIGNGNLNTAAIAAWAGGASYVVTVYDQATAGDDVTQATAANQPLYVAVAQNGHAGMQFDGANHCLQGAFTTGGVLSQPVNVFAAAALDVAAVDDGVSRRIMDGDDAGGRIVLAQNATPNPDTWGLWCGTGWIDGAASDSNWHIWASLANGASSELWIDAALQAAGGPGALNPDGLTIGAHYLALNHWDGDIVSVIVCDPSLSDAQRVAMQNAMNAYWGVY